MIVVGGENLIDLVQVRDADGLPEFRAVPGGSQYNCALALGRLGANPRYITPISTDSMGDLLADALLKSGVHVQGARVDAPSSLAVVTLDKGQPSYQFYREDTAERQVSMDSLRSSLPADISVFQIGSLSLCDGDDADLWADLFINLSEEGVYCTLDPNVRAVFVKDRTSYIARIERMIAAASLVKISDEDLGWLYPDADLVAKSKELLSTSKAQVFVLTQGAEGAIFFTKDSQVTVPAVKVENLADTVGAGDTFMAALIYQLQGQRAAPLDTELASVGAFAAKASAINCTRTGCNPPTLAEVAS